MTHDASLRQRAHDEFQAMYDPDQRRAREWLERYIVDCPEPIRELVRATLAHTLRCGVTTYAIHHAVDALGEEYVNQWQPSIAQIHALTEPEYED